MNKIYNPKTIEEKIYNFWERKKYFVAKTLNCKKNFSIVIPPPNITGNLHMGHAFQQIIMDLLIRYNRMQNKNTLFQTGIDHAGIATQIFIEKKIFKETGKKKKDYNKKFFFKQAIRWKNKCSKVIRMQMKRLGNSIDWSRERFTMDKNFSKCVQEVFINLYRDNMIYRNQKLVYWDVKLKTAVSDIEVNYKKCSDYMYYIKYYLFDGNLDRHGNNYIIVGTVRPETIFADTAIIVNPYDIRYKHLIGKYACIPFIKSKIPIIGDDYVKIDKGSGCVKITPAHDFIDYQIGKKHKLPMINIFSDDGFIRHKPKIFNYFEEIETCLHRKIPKFFRCLKKKLAKKILILRLIKECLLEKKERYTYLIPYNNRSGSMIEPILKNQWYIRIKKLAKKAVNLVVNKNIVFFPKVYKKSYLTWMYNIKDWCISRQIWWGHRIPIWYDKNKKIFVGKNILEIKKQYNLSSSVVLKRDKDVIDTWFSSALWSFASLGWPKKNELWKIFHPTNVIISGFDIIFFWIARMIMLSIYCNKNSFNKLKIPFKKVYITGLIRDDKGIKMSKSKGNVFDPIDIIDGISLKKLIYKNIKNIKCMIQKNIFKKKIIKKFPNGILPSGSDALRFSMISSASPGKNINWDMNRVLGYKKFCNKLWNVSYFVIFHTKNYQKILFKKNEFSLFDRWILIKLNVVIKKIHQYLHIYRFDLASSILYKFIWNKFCDWYIEISKIYFFKKYQYNQINKIQYILLYVLNTILRLCHPFIPFITEKIWQILKKHSFVKTKSILLTQYPKYKKNFSCVTILKKIVLIQQIVSIVRNIRSFFRIHENTNLSLYIYNPSIIVKKNIELNLTILQYLAKLNKIKILFCHTIHKNSIVKLVKNLEISIILKCKININLFIQYFNKEIQDTNIKIKKNFIKLKDMQFNQFFLKKIKEIHTNNWILYQYKNRILNYMHFNNIL